MQELVVVVLLDECITERNGHATARNENPNGRHGQYAECFQDHGQCQCYDIVDRDYGYHEEFLEGANESRNEVRDDGGCHGHGPGSGR